VNKLFYLSSPLSHERSEVRNGRAIMAARTAAALLKEGILVFSPITHTTPLAPYLQEYTFDFWKRLDLVMLSKCYSMIELRIPGWEESVGMQAERAFAEANSMSVHIATIERIERQDGGIQELLRVENLREKMMVTNLPMAWRD
jgi:hypothetical protein